MAYSCLPPIPAAASLPDRDAPVVVARDLIWTEAHILHARLLALGIPAELGDVHMAQTDALAAIALGGASIRVPAMHAAAAVEALAAVRRGEFAIDEDFDPGASP